MYYIELYYIGLCVHMAKISNKSGFSIMVKPLWSRQYLQKHKNYGFKKRLKRHCTDTALINLILHTA